MTHDRVPILLYHGVGDPPAGPMRDYVTPIDEFDRHLDVLAADGWNVWTVKDLTRWREQRGGPTPPRTAVLTFDDGFAEMDGIVRPRLEDRGWAATLYVTTGCLGASADWLGERSGRPMLDARAVVRLDAAGWEIGAHAVTHPELDVVPVPVAVHEIDRSRASLAEIVGHPIRSFAYPHGYYSTAVRGHVVEAGFESACAVREAHSWSGDDRFALARCTVRCGIGEDGLRALLSAATPLASSGRGRVARPAWRAARRLRRRAGRAA